MNDSVPSTRQTSNQFNTTVPRNQDQSVDIMDMLNDSRPSHQTVSGAGDY